MKITEVVAEHGPSTATEYLVRMRDGVRLATDVYLPKDWSDGPAILVRLPYDKRSSYVYFTRAAELFTERGYALIVQDVRGKFGSEGETLAFLNETNDGFDTIEWIVNQSWSNGKVGMFGDSYYGFTQWAAVASGHPALRAIVPRVTSANIGNRAPRPNPDGRSMRLPTLWQAKYLAAVWSTDSSYEIEWEEQPLSPRDMFDEYFDQIGVRSAYLDITRVLETSMRVFPGQHPFEAKPLPVLHVAGWFDNLKGVSFDDYVRLSSRPGWDVLQYLWVDSMDHENYRLPYAPIQPHDDFLQNDEAMERHLERYIGTALDFYDVFVREIKPASSIPRVRWHLSNGEDRLNENDSWPPLPTQMHDLVLLDAQSANASKQGGKLASGSADGSHATWIHEPSDPVPALVTNMFAMIYEYPDQQEVCARDDVLTFTSEAMSNDTDFIGQISATLRASALAPTADLIVKVLDVHPEGPAHILAWGDAEIESDGEVVEFTVDLGQVAYRVRRGHSIRLQISGSEYPTYFVNRGTGGKVWDRNGHRPVEITLHCQAGVALHMPKVVK